MLVFEKFTFFIKFLPTENNDWNNFENVHGVKTGIQFFDMWSSHYTRRHKCKKNYAGSCEIIQKGHFFERCKSWIWQMIRPNMSEDNDVFVITPNRRTFFYPETENLNFGD